MGSDLCALYDLISVYAALLVHRYLFSVQLLSTVHISKTLLNVRAPNEPHITRRHPPPHIATAANDDPPRARDSATAAMSFKDAPIAHHTPHAATIIAITIFAARSTTIVVIIAIALAAGLPRRLQAGVVARNDGAARRRDGLRHLVSTRGTTRQLRGVVKTRLGPS